MTVREDLANGKYRNKFSVGNHFSPERSFYEREQRRIYEQFKHDIETEHGVIGHPKATAVFDLAWGYGWLTTKPSTDDENWTRGYPEILKHYEKLVELIK